MSTMQDDQLRKLLMRLQLRDLLQMINEHLRLVLNEHPNTVAKKLGDNGRVKMLPRTTKIGQIGPGAINVGMLVGEHRGVAESGVGEVVADEVGGRTLKTVLTSGLLLQTCA